MLPALDAIAIAPPVRQVDPALPEPAPSAAAGFLALVAAALSSGRTDDRMSGTPASDPPPPDGEDGEVAGASTDSRVGPAPSEPTADPPPSPHPAEEVVPPGLSVASGDAAAARQRIEPALPMMAEADRAPPADDDPLPEFAPDPHASDANALAPPADPGSRTAMQPPAEATPGRQGDVLASAEPDVAGSVASRGETNDSAPPGAITATASDAAGLASRPAGLHGPAPALPERQGEPCRPGDEADRPGHAALARPVAKPTVEGPPHGAAAAETRSDVAKEIAPQGGEATTPETELGGSRAVSASPAQQGEDEASADAGLRGRQTHAVAEARTDILARSAVESPVATSPSASTSPQPSSAPEGPSPTVPVRSPADRAFVPPVRQLAPVLITLALSPQDGPARLTLSLEPEELGRIEVAVERVAEGRLAITVLAERAETLHLLQRDSALLDRALAQAGVGSEGRSLAFAFGDPGGGAPGGRGGERGSTRAGPEQAPSGARPAVATTALLDIAV